MRQTLKTLMSIGVAGAALLGSKEALAGTHGVVFIHGTGDQNPSSYSCSGSGASTACNSAATSGYWGQGEIDSIRGGHPYAVVAFNGGSCAPWASGSTTLAQGTDSYGSVGGCSTGSNSDAIAQQIATFINTSGASDIVIVTHSGGSNQARYILQNYTRNANYTLVKNTTRRVITSAGTTLGTHLADVVFSSGITQSLGGLMGYGGDGVNILRTNYISVYNGASGYFAGIHNPVSGVNFYGTGGVSGTTCYGVTVWGACVGIKGPTLGGSGCDSTLEDVALLALHTLFLNSNDASTARNSCSDGFISCMGAQALGNNFYFNQKQDHNQSRRQCNGIDGQIKAYVNGATPAQGGAFTDSQDSASQVSPKQVDACGFLSYASVLSSSAPKIGYTAGCTKSDLGDGWCDWDCYATYGHDAPATWDSTGTLVTAWGATDDCANSSNTTSNTYNGTTYIDASNNPLADNGVFVNASGSWYTQFNGQSLNGSSTVYFTDPYYGTTSATGYCPQSWVGDGTCDECVMALYGSDGTDCLPGHIVQCGGLITKYTPWAYTNNPLYNEGDPSTNGANWYFWQSATAVAGNGVCENTECTASLSNPGTSLCNSNADCASGTCSNGGCTTSASDCTANSAIQGGACTTNADCITGGTCTAGACVYNSWSLCR